MQIIQYRFLDEGIWFDPLTTTKRKKKTTANSWDPWAYSINNETPVERNRLQILQQYALIVKILREYQEDL